MCRNSHPILRRARVVWRAIKRSSFVRALGFGVVMVTACLLMIAAFSMRHPERIFERIHNRNMWWVVPVCIMLTTLGWYLRPPARKKDD
jgi:magnesium-transporting ATPase (P-type)